MTNKELANKIVELVGGEENIDTAAHCMTRVRLKIKDESKTNIADLKEITEVLGVVESDTLQIVVGPGKSKKVYDEVIANFNIQDAGDTQNSAGTTKTENSEDWKANKEAISNKQKESPLKKGLKTISNIFIPLLPAIIAAGLFAGFKSLILQFAAPEAGLNFWFITMTFFDLAQASFLGYFAIYTGINAAREFGATPALGGMIGAMSIGAQIVTISTQLGLYNEAVPLESILTTGKGGIIGVILGVWILSKVEKTLRKLIPDVLDLILTPFLSILISGLVFVAVIMPVAGYLSDFIVMVLGLLIDSPNPIVRVISGFVLAAVFLPMVLLGLHHGLIPIYAIQLETMGGVSLFPVLAMAGAGQVGAAAAIWIKARKVKNEKLEATIIGALPAGLLGVGEPLIYGVTLPLGKPFITAGLGAGFGGAYVMLMGVMATAWGPSGLVAIPLMKTPDMMLHYFIGLVLAYVAGFILTYVFIKDDIVEVK